MEITINKERRLYVLNCGEGVSCLGFENAMLETRTLARRLDRPELTPADREFGKLSVLEKRDRLLKLLVDSNKDPGTWFHPKTPRQVRDVLETSRKRVDRVRIFYGDSRTGRD
jgi:NADH:ubiquinone oxidoreductase subunit E